MTKHQAKGTSAHRNAKDCNLCGRATDLYMCHECATLLAEQLKTVGWYINRLVEQVYGQSRLGAIDSSHVSDGYGYALLIDDRALARIKAIRATLETWVIVCDGPQSPLIAPQSGEMTMVPMVSRPGHSEPLEARYARWLGSHIKMLRYKQDSHRLYHDLSAHNKAAWHIINRPADVCCGPCPELVRNYEKPSETVGVLEPCGTMLYAQEHASTVQCPTCRTTHDVDQLRESLRHMVKDMLFTGPELRRLMETRLNDRMPKASFYRLISDGRLVPRKFVQVKIKGKLKQHALFTYDDVCAAREKPRPKPRNTHGNTRAGTELATDYDDENPCGADGLAG